MTYRGTEGTRPYQGAGWYYAEYRATVSEEFVGAVVERLGWSTSDRILDLGCGPGQLAVPFAAHVGEIVGVDPEPDMLAAGQDRVEAARIDNVRFVHGGSDDLAALAPTLGAFRAVMIGSAFHWMVDQDRVLRDLDSIVDPRRGAVLLVSAGDPMVPEPLPTARDIQIAAHTLERYLASTPEGPHPRARHDPFEDILARSPFPAVEEIRVTSDVAVVESPLRHLRSRYTLSHVLTRLGDRREALEAEVLAAVGDMERTTTMTRTDIALIGRRGGS